MSDKRQRLIKIIHVARRELGMERDVYMDMVKNLPGMQQFSGTDKASIPDLTRIIDALKKRGFKVRGGSNKSKGKPHNFNSMPEMVKKVEALLADMGLSWSYADGIAKQMYGIERCAWIRSERQLQAIIAALYQRQKKQQRETAQ